MGAALSTSRDAADTTAIIRGLVSATIFSRASARLIHPAIISLSLSLSLPVDKEEELRTAISIPSLSRRDVLSIPVRSVIGHQPATRHRRRVSMRAHSHLSGLHSARTLRPGKYRAHF